MRICTLTERPDLTRPVQEIHSKVWPAFMMEDPIANRAWKYLFAFFSDFQVALCDEGDRVIAAGHAMPFTWDGEPVTLPNGWDAATQQAMDDHDAGRTPTALTAYGIVVAPDQQGKGLSSEVLKAMLGAALHHGLHSLVACVRPTLKTSYPLTPIERYMYWKREDGSPFDPWIRVHWRAGAEMLNACPQAMVIEGKVAEWEEWAKMPFPESGQYVVRGALQPINIDRERDLGRYEDPNIWMWHKLTSPVTPNQSS